jgi:hypothetical protein
MRIAWFRSTTPDTADPLDDTAALIDELRATHAIDVMNESEAYDFVWRELLEPWDLCVYELDHRPGRRFEWGYLLNYPGIVMLKSPGVENAWGGTLSREGRLDDYMAGFGFDERAPTPPPLRVPLLASRSVVVAHDGLARWLQETYPEARVRFAPVGVRQTDEARAADIPPVPTIERPTVFGLLEEDRLEVVERAFQRARDGGGAMELLKGDSPAHILAKCDVVIALTWPPLETPLTAAFAGMAAGKAVVALELDATADWPALDPQTWKPRGIVPVGTPIAVTIDPADEVHSLMLSMRRLASDAPLREQLGNAAQAWWRGHATSAHAASAWNQILLEAVSLAPPPRPTHWPKHLGADGTELTRTILGQFGLGNNG